MNLSTPCLILLILLSGLVAFSGCTATTGPAPEATTMTPDTTTPVRTTTIVTRAPTDEIARITVDHFGLDPSTGDVYEFVGKVQVSNGVYQSVQVILRYPDGQEYAFDAGGMGGSNATIKQFSLFPDDRYNGTNPQKVIALDGKRYGTVYRYENGVLAWVAMSDNPVSP